MKWKTGIFLLSVSYIFGTVSCIHACLLMLPLRGTVERNVITHTNYLHFCATRRSYEFSSLSAANVAWTFFSRACRRIAPGLAGLNDVVAVARDGDGGRCSNCCESKR
jgi:hypothetical protein